jgi:hypothetical protein
VGNRRKDKIDLLQNGVDRKLLARKVDLPHEGREDSIDGHPCIFLRGQDGNLYLGMAKEQTEELLARITGCPNNAYSCFHIIPPLGKRMAQRA